MTHSTDASATGVDAEFAELVEQITRQIQTGEQIDEETYARNYPMYAERLHDMVPALQVLADLGGTTNNSAASVASFVTSDDDKFGTVGDYRILQELGRGGMGVVYQAEQISLKRIVALKVLPFAAVLDQRQLQRFKNEALAAAQLDHPHIVDVIGVGCDRGVHHYAMRYIAGKTLAEAIDELQVAGRAGTAANLSISVAADVGRVGRPRRVNRSQPCVGPRRSGRRCHNHRSLIDK